LKKGEKPMSFSEMGRVVARSWAGLPEEEKQKLQDRAEKERQKHVEMTDLGMLRSLEMKANGGGTFQSLALPSYLQATALSSSIFAGGSSSDNSSGEVVATASSVISVESPVDNVNISV